MKLKKFFNSLRGYKELKVMATVGNYVVVANLDGQIVGLMNKNDAPAQPEFIGKVSSETIPVSKCTPASYKHNMNVRPMFLNKQNDQGWCQLDNGEEIAILYNCKPQWEKNNIAANYDGQLFFPVVKPL
jgi:hypothetical protein